jgi:hypothetical protein
MDKKFIIILACLVLLIAACQNKGTQTNDNQQPPTGSDNAAQGNNAGNTPTDNNAQDNTLKKFFSNFPDTLQYKVTYQYSTSAQGISTSGTETIVMKGKDIRTDVTTAQVSASTYILGDKIYSCSNAQGQTICYELPSNQQQQSSNAVQNQESLKQNWENFNMQMLGTRDIAGTTATCFSYEIQQGTYEYCYSSNYVLLYMKADVNGYTSELTATSFSNTVSDSEFDLPAEPQQLPS